MRLIRKIILRRVVNTREKGYISITDAKAIGFIFNANEKGIKEAVTLLEKQLQSRKINFQGVAMDLSDTQEGDPKFQSDPYVINLYKTDTDWVGIPSHDLLTKFLDRHFDIFIDLTLESIFSLDYILEKANSTVIVGYNPDKESKYDILIRSGNSILPKLSEYVLNTIEYLTTIKSN